MTKYRRIAEGLNDKGMLIPADSVPLDYARNPNKDYYVSTFIYTDAHKQVFDNTGTVAGITDVTCQNIWWDFDSEFNPEQARQDALKLIDRLLKSGIEKEDIQMSFSGNKGFGVELALDQELSPKQVKGLAFELAGDLKTFDLKMYNASRILRVVGTKHNKTGLYKTPLTLDTLQNQSVDSIMTAAKNFPEGNDEYRWNAIKLPSALLVVSDKPAPTKKESTVVSPLLDVDFTHKIKGWTNCKWALTQGVGIVSGDRHEKLLAIVSTAKSLNYTKEQAYYTAKNADEQGVIRNGGEKAQKEDIWTLVESVYSDTWKGGTYSCRDGKTEWLSDLCKGLGTHRCKKDEETVFLKSPDLFDTFYKFVINIDKNTIKTGITELDKNVMLTTSSLNGLLGQPGAGKTSIALELLNVCDKNRIPSAFYSMDMGVPLIYLKIAQKHWGIPHKELFEMIKNDANKARELKELIDKEYPNVEMCFKTGLNVDEIRDTITLYNDTRPERLKVVVIDYLECIAGPYADATANTAIIANKLKDIAIDTETCIILLLQTQKHTAAVDEPLTSMRNIKGASVIEQACSVILTLWREGYSPKYAAQGMDKFISMATVKDRFNSLWKYDFAWNGLKGKISEMNDVEQNQLEELRNLKLADKNKANDDRGGLNF